MARRSESGIDWALEMELARKGYTFEDSELGAGAGQLYDHDFQGQADVDFDQVFQSQPTRTSEATSARRAQQEVPQDLYSRFNSFGINGIPEGHAAGISEEYRNANSPDIFPTTRRAAQRPRASVTPGRKNPTSRGRSESDSSSSGARRSVPVIPPPPKARASVAVPSQEVRATVWKNPAVKPQTDYRCSDPDTAQTSAQAVPASRSKPLATATVAEPKKRGRPPTSGDGDITIAVVLPSGKRIKRKFHKSDSLTLLKDFVLSSQEVPEGFKVGINIPRRVLQCNPTPSKPRVDTFEQAGITTNEALFVELPKPGSIRRKSIAVDSSPHQPAQAKRVENVKPRRKSQGTGQGQVCTLPRSRQQYSGG